MSFYPRFDFFERSIGDETFTESIKDLKISCTNFGKNGLWIGDHEGIIYLFLRDYTSSMFIGYEKCVSLINQCKDKDILITCGMDNSISDIIKIWNLAKWSKQNVPTLLRCIDHGSYLESDFKVTSFDILPNFNSMVLGLANGKIDLIYNDVLLSKRSKRKEIYNMQEKVTTIAISQDINDISNVRQYVYITSNSRIVVVIWNDVSASLGPTSNGTSKSANTVVNIINSHAMNMLSPNNQSVTSVAKLNTTSMGKVTLDDDRAGCPMRCSVFADNIFFVANQNGIYEVYSEQVGRSRALDGDKICMYAYKNYLVVVKLITPSIITGTHLLKKSANSSTPSGSIGNYQLVIFDRVNKFVAGEFSISDFQFLFVEWGHIFVYCTHPTNKIIVFTEKDIQSKLKILFQKNSFQYAIEIAKTQNFDDNALADMFRQYGDHLYWQKHFDEAIQAYIKTIGKLEPSFVIGKFLDTSHIKNLSKYMEALVQQEECTGEHLVLLFNCYIILKDRTQLKNLIQSHKMIKLDLDNIMNLLRKVELYDEALQLALRYQRHDLYLKVLIDDLHNHDDAITYISSMPIAETEEALLIYGDTLITIGPEVIAQQLERVCSQQEDSKLSIATILNVFANNRKGLKHFLYRYISKTQNTEECHIVYVDTYLELLLYEFEKEKQNSAKIEEKIMEILQNKNIKYHKSKALLTCQERGFNRGYRLLCELREKYMDILESYKLDRDVDGIMETCYKFGRSNSEMWVKALEYLVEINADKKYFIDVIDEIEKNGLISPLLLLQKMTSGKNTLQFGLVKDYIMRYYDRNEKIIEQYQTEIERLKEDTKKNDDIIKCLNTEVQVFQNLKCVACSNALGIPSVHFLCGHSYHFGCFETYRIENNECPNCSPNIEGLLLEINQWQTLDKTTTISSQDSLSLEKLWYTVLNKSTHPISIDPQQFVADALAHSLVVPDLKIQEEEQNKHVTSSLDTAKMSANIPKSNMLHVSSEKNLVATSNIDNSRNRVNSGANVTRNHTQTAPTHSSLASSPAKSIPTQHQLNPFDLPPASSQPIDGGSSNKQSPQTISNPFESPTTNKKKQPILKKNPFESDHSTPASSSRNSPINPVSSLTNKNTETRNNNPFGEFEDNNESNVYDKSKNPFE